MSPAVPWITVLVTLLAGVCVGGKVLGEIRIVNGTEAPEGKYPLMVSIQYKGFHFCAGTILSSKWMMTAGHCAILVQEYVVDILMMTAMNKLSSGGRRHRVPKTIIHENFNLSGVLENDIALCKVCPPFLLDGKDAASKLPSQGLEYAPETPVTAVGWGFLDKFGQVVVDSLREVDLLVQNDSLCQVTPFSKEKLCAYFPGDGKGVCYGDSGGPLLLNGTQVGIVSYGLDCGVAPMVFTKVANYIDWINHKIDTN